MRDLPYAQTLFWVNFAILLISPFLLCFVFNWLGRRRAMQAEQSALSEQNAAMDARAASTVDEKIPTPSASAPGH